MTTKVKEPARLGRLAEGLTFQTQESDRSEGRILVASGTQSRNRDYYTGKPYRIVPSGMRYDAWAKAGLVLYMHNFNIPLGRGSLFLEDGQLFAPDTIDFHRKTIPIATNNWIGDAVGEFNTEKIAELWEERWLNSVSIHIMFTQEDEKNVVELEDELLIPTSEVIEFSIVTIPGDREANREKFLSMGLTPELVECLLCDDGEKQQDGLVHPRQGVYTVDNDIFLPNGGKIKVGTDRSDAAHSIPTPEVPMETQEQDVEVADEAIEEVADTAHVEEPFVAVEMELDFEEGEEELEIDTLELAHALAENQDALRVLAQAFASDPSVIQTFVLAIQENTGHILKAQPMEAPAMAAPKIRFVNRRQPAAPQALAQQLQQSPEPVVTTNVIKEAVPPEPVFAPRDPKRRRAVLGLVRS